MGGYPPASSKRIFQSVISLSRLAKTHPAVPAPTIMKSKFPIFVVSMFELVFFLKKI